MEGLLISFFAGVCLSGSGVYSMKFLLRKRGKTVVQSRIKWIEERSLSTHFLFSKPEFGIFDVDERLVCYAAELQNGMNVLFVPPHGRPYNDLVFNLDNAYIEVKGDYVEMHRSIGAETGRYGPKGFAKVELVDIREYKEG